MVVEGGCVLEPPPNVQQKQANAWNEGFWEGWNAATNGKWGDPEPGLINPFSGLDVTEGY